ncbi:MAG: hypothetical protein LBU23_07915 [Planctomycetota bacterium]|jgi:hypothetical protein|nr:hypothetical protein [Planctomycetota bacterium]
MSREEKGMAGSGGRRREHLAIHFRCCHVYGYIYKNKAGSAYSGFCPRCLAKVEVGISHDGTGSEQRIFQTG